MAVRTLHWSGQTALDRCAGQIAAACSAWAQAWSGRAAAVEVQPIAARLDPMSAALALPGGERVAVSGGDLMRLLEPGSASPMKATEPGPRSLTQDVVRTCEHDLLARVFTAVIGTGADAALRDTPDADGALPYAGTHDFEACIGPGLRLHVRVSGAALARLAPAPKTPPRPQPLDGAAVRRLAAQTPVRGPLRLPGASVPIGSLMQAEVGDVIVLDCRLDAPFEWHIEDLGLQLPAQLVRTGDRFAIELL